MQRRLLSGFALICIAVACGEATLTSSSQSKSSNNQTSGELNASASKTLRSKGSSESDVVRPVSISASQSLELAQFGTQTVDVDVQGHTPNGRIEIQPVTLSGFKVELLTSTGAALAGPVALDADGKAKFKLKLTSEVVEIDIEGANPPAKKVTAPGAASGQISLQATDAGKDVKGSIPYKLSNIALVPMNVNRVQDLPARFEFPAGTIPVFVNPSDRAVVEVMHFAGGGSGAARFKHQAQGPNNSMPAGRGYCPLNDGTTTVQVDPKQPIAPECLPCPADAAADLEGFFYDHRNEDSSLQRAIVCLKK